MSSGPLAGRVAVVSGGGRGLGRAFGRSLAAEGAGRGVLTNMLLPYALTQMTADGISDDGVRRRMTAEAVALPSGSSLSAASLAALVAESGRGKPREFGVSADAFTDLASGLS